VALRLARFRSRRCAAAANTFGAVLSLLDARSVLALRVRTRLAGEADYFHGTHTAILAALDEVRAAADPELLAEALSIAHHCLLDPDHVQMRRELAVELIKASFRTERRSDLLMGLLWQTVDAYCEGDPHAGRLLGDLKDHLGQRNHLAVGFVVRPPTPRSPRSDPARPADRRPPARALVRTGRGGWAVSSPRPGPGEPVR
jgi:hypothetical protein